MENKAFKTYEEQLEILKNRGITIKNKEEAIKILKQENYYSIINGYKNLFINKESNNEVYIKGTRFDEIHCLYNFDREMRNILLKKILIVENNVKSIIAYEFSKKYGDNDYIKLDNFENINREKIFDISKLIADIQSDIARQITRDDAISHYLEIYGYIPLWVLVKIFTFGRVSKFYTLMKQSDRRKISIEISKKFNILEKDLKGFLKLLSLFRNLCAHEERVYNFRSIKKGRHGKISPINIPKTIIHENLNITNNRNGLFDLIICLKLLLNEENFINLFNKLEYQIDYLEKEISTIKISKVLNKMNFPENWKEINKI